MPRTKLEQQIYNAAYYKANPGYWKEYRERNPTVSTQACKRHREKLRNNVYDILGHRCTWCGFEDKRALQIDHKDGGGVRHRKLGQVTLLNYVLEHPEEFQILCANCNWIKRYEDNECMKTRDKDPRFS